VRRAPNGDGRHRALGAIFALVAVLALMPGQASAEITSYTDAEGVVHLSTRPKGPRHPHPAGKLHDAFTDVSRERFDRYGEWIRQAAALYQIPEALVRAVIECESKYDPGAVSPTGAQGLMQLMPQTALRMQVRDAFDPRENIFGGTRYLRVLANAFNGDLALTIAGYNAGEAAIVRYAGVPPYAETQAYVEHVLSAYRQYRSDAASALAN
jgi:soluble lytic murein transglycosylase-like protein